MKIRYVHTCFLVLSTVLILLVFLLDKGSKTNNRGTFLRHQPPLIYGNGTVTLPWWDGGECSNRTPTIYEDQIYGHCGRRASALGSGQKVISMCLYGKDNGYFAGIEDNLSRIKEFYPGYNLRVHVDPSQYKEQLCPLLIKYDHLYVCDVNDLPSGLVDINSINKMGWRFLPLGDPQVDILLVRDSDSRIIPREVSAVNDWLGSRRTLHVMKDWRYPGPMPIPGGVWGVRADLNKKDSMGVDMRLVLNNIRDRMFNYLRTNRGFGGDMQALKDSVYPVLKSDMVRHDSFHCKDYPESWPWPTQKNLTDGHVGQRHFRSAKFNHPEAKCPIECRPPTHRDWEFC